MFEKIKKIIDEWDPLNLYPYAPSDEYKYESIDIYMKISNLNTKTIDMKQIKDIIIDVFSERFEDTLIIEEKEYNIVTKRILNLTKYE